MTGRRTEITTGLLVLICAAVLGGLVWILADFASSGGTHFYVDFKFAGTLAKGAPVKVSGIKVGKIEDISFLAGRYDARVKRRVYVRMKVWVQERARKTIRCDSEIYVNTQGVLGEEYLEITPGTMDDRRCPPVKEGQILKGQSPPRADLVIGRLYSYLEVVTDLLKTHRHTVGSTLKNAARALGTADGKLNENRDSVRRFLRRGYDSASQAARSARSARRGIGEGRRLNTVLAKVERAASTLSRRLNPALDKVKKALDRAIRAADRVGPTERDRLMSAMNRVARFSSKAERTADDAARVVRRIRAGQGAAGRLVMDRDIYEDLKEMVRDLKRNPWKLFWKE